MSKDYKQMTMRELYEEWVVNWTIMSTGLRDIMGDEPMPDPREVANLCRDMPEDVWTGIFESATARMDLKKKMDVQKLMAEIGLENVAILNAAITHAYRKEE